MLFDLRGRGRRNTIKVIYVSLALLMGGGLVLFGIGGNTSGGLVDAITGTEGGDVGADRYEREQREALAAIRASPNNRVAYEDLMTARTQLAGLDNQYDPNTDSFNDAGQADLRGVVAAWEDYQELDLPVDEEYGRAAKRAADAYFYLGQTQEYVEAQEIVAEARNATGPYQQLAEAAYSLGQTRKGDLAAQKAVELAPEDDRDVVQQTLDQIKQQAAGSTTASPSPSAEAPPASPEPTAAPEDSEGANRGGGNARRDRGDR